MTNVVLHPRKSYEEWIGDIRCISCGCEFTLKTPIRYPKCPKCYSFGGLYIVDGEEVQPSSKPDMTD